VPKPFPAEFRADVIAVARQGRSAAAPDREGLRDLGGARLHRWLKIADREDGAGRPASAAPSEDVSVQLREAHKRIKLLGQEAEVMRRAVGYLSRDANPKCCTCWSSTLLMTACPSR
jgi:transposase